MAIFNRHLERRVAQELSVRLVELASGFELDADGRPQVTRLLADPRYDQPYSGAYWQAADAAGPVLRSRSLWDQRLAAAPPDEQRGVAFETEGPNGSTLYVLEREVKFAAATPPRFYRLSVALDHAELEELGASFLGDEALALSAIGAVLILGAWLQISLGLLPLRRLHAQLALIRQGRSGRLEGRVRVGAGIEGDLVRVHVDDDGPGIHPDRRQQMAERGESGAAPGEGAGLGLSIVTDVLASYGAALTIADSPLGGCRVTFAAAGWSELPPRATGARAHPQPDRTRTV